jgi:hypothetical protein
VLESIKWCGGGSVQGDGEVLGKLLGDKGLALIAQQHGIAATAEERNLLYQHFLKIWGQGSETQLEKTLNAAGTNIETLKRDILPSLILEPKLNAWYNGQEEFNKNILDLGGEIKTKLQNGTAFAALAQGYNQDESTKAFFGDSGFIELEDTLPELMTPLGQAKAGDILILPSRFGVHVIEVTARENNQLQLQQIFLKTSGFTSWYTAEYKKIPIKMFISF